MFACSDSRPVSLGARPDGQISLQHATLESDLSASSGLAAQVSFQPARQLISPYCPSQALEFFDAGLNGVIEFEL